MMKRRQEIIDRMIEIAEVFAENSNGKIRLAYDEKDEATNKNGSEHFFKLNGKRVGRDFESYTFDSEMVGQVLGLIEFADTIGRLKRLGLSDSWEAVRHDCANLSEFLTGQVKSYVPVYRALFSIPSPKKTTDE